MSNNLRIEKLQELIKQEMSKSILQEIKDPRIGFVTVTDVKLSKDLSVAKIFVSIMGSDEQIKDTLEGLKSALGFLRHEIAKKVRMKYTPKIYFALDTSQNYSEHIQKLLLEISNEEKEREI